MADKASAIFHGDGRNRKIWKSYALVFANMVALLTLFYWTRSSDLNIYDQIQLKHQELISEGLVLDKLMMNLRSGKDKNYKEILVQQDKVVSGFKELKSFLLSHSNSGILRASASNIDTFITTSKNMSVEILEAHSSMVDAREKKNILSGQIVSRLKSGTPEDALFALRLAELRASSYRYFLKPEKALEVALTRQKRDILKLANKQFSKKDILSQIRSLFQFYDAESKAQSDFIKSISQYSDSKRYEVYRNFNQIYNRELEVREQFIAYLNVVLYLLIFGACLQFFYLFYTIKNKDREFIEQTDELKKGLESQKELNELQRKFVSMVSHEFRTPLAIIDSGAQKMLRRADTLTANKIMELGAKIRSHINKLIELLDSTLHSQRMEAGAMELMPGPCDLKLIIGDVCQLQYEIHTRNTIQLNISELPSEIIADDKLVAHVVTNLVSNAVKYSPDGTEVVIIGRDLGDFVEIEVQDSGVGIPPEEIAELFNCFYRASTSIGISGTGIGLHLVKNIIDRHNGTIEVTSEVGKGSVFIVRLPKAPANYVRNNEADIEQVA